jgi:hypothetical protein
MKQDIRVGDVVELIRNYPCISRDRPRGIVKRFITKGFTRDKNLWIVVIPRRYVINRNGRNINTLTVSESEMVKVH